MSEFDRRDFLATAAASAPATSAALLEPVVKTGPILRTALLIAMGFALVAVKSGLADERQDSGKLISAAPSDVQRTAASGQSNPRQAARPGGQDHVRYHGALGVSLSKSEERIVVVGVIPGSPAARAGLRLGDEIRNVGEQRIHTIPEVTETIGDYQPGAQVDLSIRRNGRPQVVEAILGAREAIFVNDERSTNDEALRTSGAAIGRNPQFSRARGPDSRPSGATDGELRDRQISLRMRALERQIDRLHQELNDARYSQRAPAAGTFDASAWWERQHHGQADNDPALFQ